MVLQFCIATSFKPPLSSHPRFTCSLEDPLPTMRTFEEISGDENLWHVTTALQHIISESIADYGRRCICTGLSPSGMQFVRRVILLVRDSIKTEAKIATTGLVRGTTWIFPNLTSMSAQLTISPFLITPDKFIPMYTALSIPNANGWRHLLSMVNGGVRFSKRFSKSTGL